ncbi:MAG: DNA methyltransferase, partial [Promethearchaeia archaeon]
MVEEKPIEKYFPIHEVNQIASYESTGFGRRWYRPIYVIHKWWARRLGTIFRSIILYSLINEKKNNFLCNKKGNIETHIKSDTEKLRNWKNLYYRDLEFKDKTILDPFFGGGTTIIEALRLGCKVIGKELNPVAWFVTKKEVEPVSLPKLKEQFEIIDKQISSEILKYYKTKCPVCGKEASVMYFFWYKVLNCLNCKEEVPLFKDYRIGKYRSINSEHKKRVRCVSCNEFYDPLKNEKCPYCGENFEYKKYYYVLCPQCKKLFGMHLYRKASKNENTPCPHCGHNFNPKKGPASGQYYTCSNGHKRKIIETIQRNGKPKEELYAIEYFCEYCDKRGYKSIDNFDKDLFQKAVQEYKDIKNSLPIPRTKIQNGYNTKQILNHKYEKFDDLFNKRQLLNLGKIFQKILEIDDQNIKEYFILAFSNTLKYNNMLCKYDRSNNTITDIFRTHTYHPSFTPVECSCYNAPRGRGSFSAFINLVIEGKEFNNQPHEYIIHPDRDNERVDNFSPFHGIVKNEFKEIKEENRVLLFNGSSEYLEIPDKSVDAVITDPPYYDNVMYSELSDF